MRLQVLIPIASIVSSLLALSVIWWATQRRKEREAFYRFELARLMVERYTDGQEKVLAWLRDQEAADFRRHRATLHAAAWVLLAGGCGALVGLRFTTEAESLFGWVPVGVAAGLFLYLLLSRRKGLEPPPFRL